MLSQNINISVECKSFAYGIFDFLKSSSDLLCPDTNYFVPKMYTLEAKKLLLQTVRSVTIEE